MARSYSISYIIPSREWHQLTLPMKIYIYICVCLTPSQMDSLLTLFTSRSTEVTPKVDLIASLAPPKDLGTAQVQARVHWG